MCGLPLFPCLQLLLCYIHDLIHPCVVFLSSPAFNYYFVTSLISSIHVWSSSLPLPSIITLLHPWSHPSTCGLPLFPCLHLLLCYIPGLIHPCVVFLSSPAFTYYFDTSLISSIHVWSSSLPLPSIITLLHPWSHPSMCGLPLFPCLQLLLCYIHDLIHPCVVFLSSPAFNYYFVTSLISSIHVWSSSLPLPSIITLLHP